MIDKAVEAYREAFRQTYGDKAAERAFVDGPSTITAGVPSADPYGFAKPQKGHIINPYPTDPSKFWGLEPQ